MRLGLTAALVLHALLSLGTTSAAAQEGPKCVAPPVPAELLIEKVRTSGFEHEIITDKRTVFRIAAMLMQGREELIEPPTQIVVVFVGDMARIGFINDDKLCVVLTGPADEFRKLLRAIHGISIKGGIAAPHLT